jgi:Protein of unknown function (DUF3891)
MVIGWSRREVDPSLGSAWARVEAAQRVMRLPCLLVPQPAHAVLAGELAAGLLPSSFGELPPEIRRAIQMHDTGWAGSDAQQIQRLRAEGAQASKATPISFVAISPAEAEEAWIASIDSVEGLPGGSSKMGAIIVSRHFSLLAQHDQAGHSRFLEAEKARQRRLSNAAGVDDLERWTAALGLCDLVSLYLLSGLSDPVEFPLAHPASPQARTAKRVKMEIEVEHGERSLRFTPEMIRAGCRLSIQALKHPVPAQGARAETLAWEVK